VTVVLVRRTTKLQHVISKHSADCCLRC